MKARGPTALFLAFFVAFYIVVELPAITTAFPQEPQSQDTLTQPAAEPPPSNSDSNLMSMFVMMIGLIVVFSFVLYLGLKVYKQTIVDKRFGGIGPEIKVLGSSVIGPKKSLCVVNAFQHILLLGMTESQINVLLDIPFEKLSDELRASLQNPSKSEINFRKILDRFASK